MTRGTPILGNHPARQVANVTLRMGTSHGRPAIGSCVMVGVMVVMVVREDTL